MPETPEWQATDELRGIRGWLLLPLAQLIFNLLYIVWLPVRYLPEIAAKVPGHEIKAIIGYLVVQLPYFAFLVFCLARFLQERKATVWLMTVFYGLNIAIVLAFLLAPAVGIHVAPRSAVLGRPAASFVAIGIWLGLLAYFHTSLRVKNTFFRTAPPRAEVAGLGGWLIVVLPFVALWMVGLISVIKSPFTLLQRLAWSTAHGTIYPYRLVASEAMAVFLAYALIRALQRRRVARVLLMIASALGVAYGMAIILLRGPGHATTGLVAAALWLAIGAYFWRSQRVNNTFVK